MYVRAVRAWHSLHTAKRLFKLTAVQITSRPFLAILERLAPFHSGVSSIRNVLAYWASSARSGGYSQALTTLLSMGYITVNSYYGYYCVRTHFLQCCPHVATPGVNPLPFRWPAADCPLPLPSLAQPQTACVHETKPCYCHQLTRPPCMSDDATSLHYRTFGSCLYRNNRLIVRIYFLRLVSSLMLKWLTEQCLVSLVTVSEVTLHRNVRTLTRDQLLLPPTVTARY